MDQPDFVKIVHHDLIGGDVRTKCIIFLTLFIFLAACDRTESTEIPSGVSLLKGIDPAGLQSPIWSPNGRKILASYVIEGMPDIAGVFAHQPRHDIILVDPESGNVSQFQSVNSGNLVAEAWSPDSQSFAMFWSDGPDGNGIYRFTTDRAKPTYLSKYWGMSPDWKKNVAINGTSIEISEIGTLNVTTFKLPAEGNWSVSAWSQDTKFLTLVNREHEGDRFETIYLFDTNSGSFTQFTHDSIYFKESAVISPNDKFVAYIIWRFTEGEIENKMLISRFDQSCAWTIPVDPIHYFAWSPDSQRLFLIGDGVYLADLRALFGDDFVNDVHCP